MTDLTIVEWGGGSGFTLFEHPGQPRPPAPFVTAAENLIRYPVVQPPEWTGDPERFPVWCLVHVEVGDRGPHWCFTVQGRDGAFGRAGSCQFLFVGAENDPSAVWLTGITMVGPDGRLCDGPMRKVPFTMTHASRLTHPLAALAADRDRVPVDGDPLAVAADITALLRVLPLAVIRSRIWATFLLKRPVLEGNAVVSGHWPAELADNNTARGAREWLGEVQTTAHEQDDRVNKALGWVADQAADGAILADYRGLPNMHAFVRKVIHDEFSIRVEDVPQLLAMDPDGLRAPKAIPVVTEWAQGNPLLAIAHLVPPRLPPDLADAVLDGVLEAHYQATGGSNPALFPPDEERPYPGWHDFLADALKRRLPRQQDRVEFVRDTLLAPGRPLTIPGAVARAATWLTRIGVSPDDPAITIFPPSVDAIVAALSRPNGAINPNHQVFLRDSTDQGAVIDQVVDRLRYISPHVADHLLDAMSEHDDRVWLLRKIVSHNTRQVDHPTLSTPDWVDQLTARHKDPLAVVEGAYYFLATNDELTDNQLSQALQVYSGLSGTDTARILLLEAARRVNGRGFTVQSGRAAASTARARRPRDTQDWHPGAEDFGPTGSHDPYAAASTYPGLDNYGGRPDIGRPVTWGDGGHTDWNRNQTPDDHRPRTAERPTGSDQHSRWPADQEMSPVLRLALIVGGIFVVVFIIYQLFVARLG